MSHNAQGRTYRICELLKDIGPLSHSQISANFNWTSRQTSSAVSNGVGSGRIKRGAPVELTLDQAGGQGNRVWGFLYSYGRDCHCSGCRTDQRDAFSSESF